MTTDDTIPAHATFDHLCLICGATVHVVDGREQPHRCRIEISNPAQAKGGQR